MKIAACFGRFAPKGTAGNVELESLVSLLFLCGLLGCFPLIRFADSTGRRLDSTLCDI